MAVRFPWQRLMGAVLVAASLGAVGGGMLYIHDLRRQIQCYAEFSTQFAGAVDRKTAAETDLWNRFVALMVQNGAREPTPAERQAGLDEALDALQTYLGDLATLRAIGRQPRPCGDLP